MKLIPAFTAAVLLLPALAQAQTSATTESSLTDGVIYACYVPKTGTVYRINVAGSPTKCSPNHVSFSWNIAGAEGPQGPQGPQGPAGTGGLTNYSVSSSLTTVLPGEVKGVGTGCSDGQIVLGGGVRTDNIAAPDGVVLVWSAPRRPGEFGGPDNYAWVGAIRNDSQVEVTIRVYAICALLAS